MAEIKKNILLGVTCCSKCNQKKLKFVKSSAVPLRGGEQKIANFGRI